MNYNMNTKDRAKTLIVGLGNQNCGDDAVGPMVARYIARKKLPDCDVTEESGEPMSLMSAMRGREEVFLIDAIMAITAPGTLHMFDASKMPLPSELFSHMSTHSFGLVESVELARALGELPPRLLVVGIEGLNFEPGDDMAPPVESAIAKAVDWILSRINSYTHTDY